jgi:hypothetical protein
MGGEDRISPAAESIRRVGFALAMPDKQKMRLNRSFHFL